MEDSLTLELPVRTESAKWARDALKEFRGRFDESSFIDTQLLLSELVSDAVLTEADDAGSVRVRIEARKDRLRLELSEGADTYRMRSRRPEAGAPGWGLHLTSHLAESWGTRRDGDRSCVWFQMTLRSPVFN
jgi:anti-sigma regulatory factor (Ser/Thr protein kinase)